MFPNNQFFQCPTYFASSVFFSIVIIITIILVVSMTTNTEIIGIVGSVLGLFMTFWTLRLFYLSFYPNPDCEAKGFPGQYFWPWSPIVKK